MTRLWKNDFSKINEPDSKSAWKLCLEALFFNSLKFFIEILQTKETCNLAMSRLEKDKDKNFLSSTLSTYPTTVWCIV